MIDRKLFLSDLQKQVKNLEKDLREQADSVEEVRLKLRGEYDHTLKVGRTAATWAAWRDERITQVAVAWVLGTVFDKRHNPLYQIPLREILPWGRQWHGECDPEWGSLPADIYAAFLAETTNRLHLTDEALTSWRPPAATRGRKAGPVG
ncbi:DUF7008 domain-containing protein [Micromonospora carbonacea]|uniref:DUF7008 domain-containing protein n=1 Tax=Micromonospora carbonacea TaxID=47853 RepID=UPI0037224590